MIRCDHRFISSSITQTTASSSMSVRYKSYYGEAEYSGMYGNYVIETLGDYSVPTGWPMKPYKRPYGGTPGPPVMYEKPSDPEEEGAGYGYSNGMSQQERDVFYYHPDHLGSSSFITDTEGEVVQHIEYVPYGEVFIEERNNVWNTPYLFNAKEFDEETGLYYYGARYYDPRLAIWYGVDALAEKYPNMSPYNYCVGNPVKFVDPDGERVYLVYYQNTENFNVIADTRRREIETSDDFDSSKDHVYMASFDDVSEIINMTSDFISNSKECGYGKTVELSIYSHCGSDGPIGTVNTTQFSLGEDTGSHFDDNQMTINGWSSIDFNFDNHSIAAFYGCQSAFFAQKFISKIGNKPAYSAGFGGRAGDSKSMDVFSPNIFSIFDKVGDNLYMMDGMGLVVYDKNARETNVSFQIQTNIQINTNGTISGPTRTGRKSWSTNDIKGYND